MVKDKLFPINIKLILVNSSLVSNWSGHCQRFLKSLVILEYNKKISLNNTCCIEQGALLSYPLAYQKENQMEQFSCLTVCKKLIIKMYLY